jgi:MinD-like ATPase involved in chromosome partitioning or flagellar assembly
MNPAPLDLRGRPLVDGRPAAHGALGRARRRVQRLLVSQVEREEAVLEQRLRAHPGVTRANTVALMSPKGGVGKTTVAFLVGNLLCTHLKLRAIAVDASPGFGTLARLAPDAARSRKAVDDLLDDADRLRTAAELRPYVSRLPTGLHVLAAPHDSTAATPDRYGELVALLSCFYEVILLDLAAGIVGPLASFATRRVDQVVLVTTAEWVAATVVLGGALPHLHAQADRMSVVINRSARGPLPIPHDEQLADMLDTGTYALEALSPPTRAAIKRLGREIAAKLV